MSTVFTVLLFIIALPIAMELIGALLALRDGWCDRGARSAGINRLAVRIAILAVFLTLAPQRSWWVFGAAAATVLFAHVLSFYSFRLISRRFPAAVIDRDQEQP